MIMRVLCGLVILLCAWSASAQTHPCDTVPPTSFVIIGTAPAHVGFCHDGKSVDAQTLSGPLGSKVFVTKGTAPPTAIAVTSLAPLGLPNAAGYSYFEVRSPELNAALADYAKYTIQHTVFSGPADAPVAESAKTAVINFERRAPVPTVPKQPRIIIVVN